MRKILFLSIVAVLFVFACGSSTDNADKYFEPVEEKYKTIEVPIIYDIDLLTKTGGE